MLHYVPLESYPQRYTSQLSAAQDGWYERNWRKYDVPYKRIAPRDGQPGKITTGLVVDALNRADWSFQQITELIVLATKGKITNEDVIFFDDFWTPGILHLKYTFELLGIKPKMYATCWAQSWDEYDFTAKMGSWMRHAETSLLSMLDGVFVANTLLKELICDGSLIDASQKVHVVGLPFCSEEVGERMHFERKVERENLVVFSSRFDKEKRPEFFMDVIERIMSKRKDIKFAVSTNASELRSNSPRLVTRFKELNDKHPDNVSLYQHGTKESYYQLLRRAKVQFNCALQDWVSFTLLEAVTAGCFPVYPNFRSFPETFKQAKACLYTDDNVPHAVEMIESVIDADASVVFGLASSRQARWADIVEAHDYAWARMLKVMLGENHSVFKNLDLRLLANTVPYPE